MLKAIIFDLDDTLLWDSKSVSEAFKATCQLAVNKYDIDATMLEMKVRESAEKIYPTYDIYDYVSDIEISTFEAFWGDFNDEGEIYEKFRKIVADFKKRSWLQGLKAMNIDDDKLANQLADTFPIERKRHVYLFEETIEVLNYLKNKFQLLLLTNGSTDLQKTKLNLSPELKKYFDYIVISGDFGTGKPHPSIFEHAINLLSVNKDEAIMIGDNLYTDILGASRVGLKSIWINHHNIQETEVTPTYEVSRLKEIIPVINQLSV